MIQLQLRQDSASVWTSNNPTLSIGEVGVESDTLKMKVGNGFTAWTSLAYVNTTSSLWGTASWANNAITSAFVTASNVNGSVNSAYSGAISATVTGPYYVDLSTGSTGLQPTFVNTTLVYNTANNYLSTTGFSGSLYGTSSWASNATTASWAGALSGAHSGPLTGSVFGTASSAVLASSSSFGGGLPLIQSGVTAYTAVATISPAFNKAFPTNVYGLGIAFSGSTFVSSSRISATTTTGFTAQFQTGSGWLLWNAIGNT